MFVAHTNGKKEKRENNTVEINNNVSCIIAFMQLVRMKNDDTRCPKRNTHAPHGRDGRYMSNCRRVCGFQKQEIVFYVV